MSVLECVPEPRPARSHLPARRDVPGQLHFGEVPLPDGLQQPVVSHVRRIVRGDDGGVLTAGGADGAGQRLTAPVFPRCMLGNKEAKQHGST